jgi:hypothetical protein
MIEGTIKKCIFLMQVVNFLPRALFINRVGTGIILSDYHTELEEHVCPTDPPKVFRWRSEFGNELLKVINFELCLLRTFYWVS